MKSSKNLLNIKQSLSNARLSTFERATNNLDEAIKLYQWNMQISSAFLECLSVCEVVIRNAVSNAIQSIHGENWAYNQRFLRTIQGKRRNDLIQVRQDSIDSTIPELPFVFWQSMFTARFDNEIWQNQLAIIMPHANHENLRSLRREIYTDLDNIRKLRNRIAHHEPIFNRNLQSDYYQILKIIGYQNQDVAEWLESWQTVTTRLNSKPI